MSNENRKVAPLPPEILDRDDFLEEIHDAIRELARLGLIVDSGERRWSERTGRYEIVWKSKVVAH
jgi:hypothetical protein